tara:strand:+ start:1599 stop:2249 length:651 start_codon:yes stop_codon:yes gene_type:complete
MMTRQIKNMMESKKPRPRQGGNNNHNNNGRVDRPKGKYNQPPTPKTGGGGSGGFEKPGLWRGEDVEEKNKLKLIAQKNHENAKKDKNENQKIRLNLNIIAPDNYTKKFAELRGYLFPGLKMRSECKEEGIDYNEEEHKLLDGNINEEILKTIVDNIFRKAQIEKEFTIFYGKLCEELTTLEINLRDEAKKLSNMKNSQFRKQILEFCRSSFEKFFD